jgi:hypothetical protein
VAWIKLKMMYKLKMNKKEYNKPTIKIVKVGIVLLLIAITFTTTYLKFSGDNWGLEIIFLIAQLYYSIYGGFYAYLFDKPMSGRFSSVKYIYSRQP